VRRHFPISQRQAHPSTTATVSATSAIGLRIVFAFIEITQIHCISEHCEKSFNELKVFFWSGIVVIVSLVEDVTEAIGHFHRRLWFGLIDIICVGDVICR
jgi:hypothetical protein